MGAGFFFFKFRTLVKTMTGIINQMVRGDISIGEPVSFSFFLMIPCALGQLRRFIKKKKPWLIFDDFDWLAENIFLGNYPMTQGIFLLIGPTMVRSVRKEILSSM